MSKAKIICTLGPSSNKVAILEQMAQAGMSIARLNFSHGNHKTHQHLIDIIREVNAGSSKKVKILQDLEGFRLRVGLFKGPHKSIELVKDTTVTLIKAADTDQPNTIPLDYDGSLAEINDGCMIFIDDGNLALQVKSHTNAIIKAKVIVPGMLKEHKGINIPGISLQFDSLTQKDKTNLIFGIKNKVDMVAQSFVRNKEDILNVRQFMQEHNYNCPLIAKIENQQGIDNIDEILEVADGIMIARGDMGVSLPIYHVPIVQKMIIRKCLSHKAFVITATQMLESMTENLRPTRAEVSDVANAIIDGSDFVMLSGETAAGRHPVQVVQMMNDIIKYTEKNLQIKA